MPVSIYDIAMKAGVAPSTVSRALQDHPRIGAKTKVRIQALADEMGYVPSAVAKSLVDNKTWTIGVVITTVADPVLANMVNGVEEVAHKAGYSVFLSNSRNDSKRETSVIEGFHRRRVDAVIVVASRLGGSYVSELDQLNVPVVLIESQKYKDQKSIGHYHAIDVDNKGGARDAVNHLIELGHRRIGYVGAVDRPRSNNNRMEGYTSALEAAGIPVQQELISIPDADNDYERGELGLEALKSSEVTAVFCYNDRTAIGVMKGCEKHNIEIPEQLSIVGFDDISIAPYLRPSLTTVHQPLFRMGKMAMEMTLKLIHGEEIPNKTFSCELVIRETTAKIGT